MRLSATRPWLFASAPWIALSALACTAGCEQNPMAPAAEAQPVPFTVRAAEMSPDTIPDESVSGELAGEPFALEDAAFRVEPMERRQRVDLWLSDERMSPCGVPLPTEATKVWIRFPGIVDLETGVHRVEADDEDPEFELHYERWTDHGWQSGSGGAALLIIDEADAETVTGRLKACFDDGAESCVEGRFGAPRCRGPLDPDDDVSGAGVLDPDRPLP